MNENFFFTVVFQSLKQWKILFYLRLKTFLKETEKYQDYKAVRRKSRSKSYGAIFSEIEDTLKEKNVTKISNNSTVVT